MYENQFHEAIDRTKRFGLSVPKTLYFKQDRFLNDKNQKELLKLILSKMGEVKEGAKANQCIALNCDLKDILSEFFDCPIYYTIGYVELNELLIFKQTEESLKAMLINNIPQEKFKLHVWLTLPTMEIFDFTFGATYRKEHRMNESIDEVIVKQPSEHSEGNAYHPMLIGVEFLFKIGAIKLTKDT